MEEFMTELMTSKYHLSVAKRMYSTYSGFPEKRIIIGTINELEKSSSNFIRAFLKYSGKKRIEDFSKESCKIGLNAKTGDDVLKILEIGKNQKTTPIQFHKDDKIIMMVDGKYKILTIGRIKELLESLEFAIKGLQNMSRQI